MKWEEWKASRRDHISEDGAFSDWSPALVSHAGSLWCFWTQEGNIYYSRWMSYGPPSRPKSEHIWLDGEPALSDQAQHMGVKSAPGVVSMNGTLYLMFIDEENTLWQYSRGDADPGFDHAVVVTRNETGKSEKMPVDRFSLAAKEGKLHCIYRLTTDGRSRYLQSMGVGEEIELAPQFCVEADGEHHPTLVPSWRPGETFVWLMKWDENTSTFRTWQVQDNNRQEARISASMIPFSQGRIAKEVGATSAAGMVFISYLINEPDNIGTLHGEEAWQPETIHGENALTVPALAVHEGNLFCAWNDRGSRALRYACKPTFPIWPLNSWMASLDGTKRLSQITIPGTHDSCAKSLWPNTTRYYLPENFFCTQSTSIESQLVAGIRFLDIRGRFGHGINEQNVENASPLTCHASVLVEPEQTIETVFNICYDFLRRNDTETIVMSLKCEDAKLERAFATKIRDLIFDKRDFWHLNSTTVPTLNEVRRKIILLRRFGLSTAPATIEFGIDGYKGWPPKDITPDTPDIERLTLMVQDRWNYSFDQVTHAWDGDYTRKKFQLVQNMLLRAAEDPRVEAWYLNFTSATAVPLFSPSWFARGQSFKTPAGIAYVEGVNQKLLSYLQKSELSHVGIVIMDFPEAPEELVSVLVNLNSN